MIFWRLFWSFNFLFIVPTRLKWFLGFNLIVDPEMREPVIEERFLMFELGDDVAVERRLQVEPDGLDVDDVVRNL